MTSIYLDYAATTPVDSRVIAVMNACLGVDATFANPSSTHSYGQHAAEKIEKARQQVASLVNAEPREIIWTSGATESNNLAIQGVAHFYHKRGKHIITMKTEHKAVLDVCRFLEKQGFELTYLSPEPTGLLNLEELKAALRPDTLLVSIMFVNNETGIIQPIKKIADIVKSHGCFFHVDAAQALGKLAIDLKTLPVDLMSFSAHKIYGPKGAGALFVRHRPTVRLEPLIYGGGHEQGLRSGTLATHQLVGMGEACAILQASMAEEVVHIEGLKQHFWKNISQMPAVTLNGQSDLTACHILNVCFSNIDNVLLMSALPQCALSAGSACTSLEIRPSHVLQAMRLSDQEAHSSVRFSFGRYTTLEEIEKVSEMIRGLTVLNNKKNKEV